MTSVRTDTYRIFKRGDVDWSVWRDLGWFEGRWEGDAVEKAAAEDGDSEGRGRYLLLSQWGYSQYDVTARTEYSVDRVEKPREVEESKVEAVGMSE